MRTRLVISGAVIALVVAACGGSEGTAFVRRVHARYLTDAAWEIPSVSTFLEANDVALELVPGTASLWDERGQEAIRELLDAGAYRPLAPTTPR